MEGLAARALLARVPSLSTRELTALVDAAGGEPERAVEARSARQVELSQAARSYLAAPDEAALAADLAWLESSGARILLGTDPEYPALLRQSADPPAALYVLGQLAALGSPQLAMIGSRSPTAAGLETAREFAAWFAQAGLTITSGLAVGIDAACHAGALEAGGFTVAVCGTGLDESYPRGHAGLARRIATSGALVSEYPPRTAPAREHFLRRNRIIAGLARGTLVVEAARHSGSLVTARLAAEAGREVFAIPGSIHSPLSKGCHQLIKQGAKLVEEAADVLAELKISFVNEELTPPMSQAEKPPALDKEYEMLLDALGFEPATIDTLVARTGLPAESVASMLLILELDGRAATLPGGRYGRTP